MELHLLSSEYSLADDFVDFSMRSPGQLRAWQAGFKFDPIADSSLRSR